MSDGEHSRGTDEVLTDWPGVRAERNVRVAGAWLALGSLLLVGSLLFHPPPPPDLGEFMATIAADSTRWVAVHWAAAMALTLFVLAGLIVLTAGSRLTRHWWTVTAWATLVVGALWVTVTAVAEATVIAAAAVAGDAGTFEAWQLFADGTAVGFGLLALAVAVIAGNEARTRSTHAVTPAWAAWIGALAAVVAFVAYVVLGLLLGIELGGVVWLGSTIVMGLWTLWFGVALGRSDESLHRLETAGARGRAAD